MPPLFTALLQHLRARREHLLLADRYYTGDHPLPFLTKQAAVRYRELVRMARTNWPALIVDAVADRLAVEGFRLDNEVDATAWDIWQANGLDAEHALVHTDCLVYGETYAMVWPDEDNAAGVRITPETPYEVVHRWAPSTAPRRVDAALKAWWDEGAGVWRAFLFTVEEVQEFAASPRKDKGLPAASAWRAAGPAEPNPFAAQGMVGVVAFCNRMRSLGEGRSELDGLLPQVDRLNTTVAQRVLAGEYAAFRQRWATGLEVPEDADGKPVEPFNVAVDRLWVSEDKDTRFGSFDVTDLRPYIDAVAQDVQHLASVSRTPPHYLLGDMVNLSAEALKAAEAGLVSKVRQRMRAMGEAWETTMRLALALRGNVTPVLDRLETVWADPENISEATRMDALTKMQALQVPLEALWERMPGTTPTEVARWRSMRGTDTVQQMLRTGRVQPAPIAEGPGGQVVEPAAPAAPPAPPAPPPAPPAAPVEPAGPSTPGASGAAAAFAAEASSEGDACPAATQDVALNLRNRQKAIELAHYGPMNPADANEPFWQAKASMWGIPVQQAQGQKCGNCAAFIRTPKMLDCIAAGLAPGGGQGDAWDVVDQATLGYCEMFDFKCAAARTCDAWVVGGPVT